MIVDLPLAPIAILAFLGSCLAATICLAVLIHPAVRSNSRYRRAVLTVFFAGIALYGLLLLGFSLASEEHVLARGAEKHFCEVDCHLAYSVVDVRHTKPLSYGSMPKMDDYVVTLRTRFDETTINPQRGNGILYPNPRKVFVIDEHGNRYTPLLPVDNMTAGTPLTHPLRPGESYTTALLFSLPADVQSPKLFVSNAPWPNHLLIGHENSPLHKKAYFAI